MAVTINSRQIGSGHAGSTGTNDSFTINNASPAIFGVAWMNATTLTAATWDTIAVDTIQVKINTTGTGPIAMCIVNNPHTGTHNFLPTFSAASEYIVFAFGTAGGNTATPIRAFFTRKDTDGVPGMTITDSQVNDLLVHLAIAFGGVIDFEAAEDDSITLQNNLFGNQQSMGMSSKAAGVASTVDLASDYTAYSEIAVAVRPGGQSLSVNSGSYSLGGTASTLRATAITYLRYRR